jgi:polyhydroxybutyrate depolymerase
MITYRIAPIVLGVCTTLNWGCANASQTVTQTLDGRSAVLFLPTSMPPMGARALVVVLHGGLGNAQRVSSGRSESALNMNDVADREGFVVAYLNGTPVTRFLGADKLGWNAGNCCGLPADKNVNDVGYLEAAVRAISKEYGIAPQRVFGIGHSNGAMMTQRVMCESTLYAAAVAVSGPLDSGATSCPAAAGKRILAIHGEDDQNVPIDGGRGTKGLLRANFASQAHTVNVWKNSGATYELEVIKGADHSVDAISTQLLKLENQTLAQKAARFFGTLER